MVPGLGPSRVDGMGLMPWHTHRDPGGRFIRVAPDLEGATNVNSPNVRQTDCEAPGGPRCLATQEVANVLRCQIPPNLAKQRLRRSSPQSVGGAVDSSNRLWRASQVAEYFGITLKRVYQLDIPLVRVSPRTLRWRPDDVYEWAKERRLLQR